MWKKVKRKIGFFHCCGIDIFVTDCIIVSWNSINSDMEAQHEQNQYKIFLSKVSKNDVAIEKFSC